MITNKKSTTPKLRSPTMTYPYTQPEFDAFGWSTLSRAELAPYETHGLDYESAREATPQWFAVSSGNGNDGVSHMFPDYYCRCSASEAFDLTAAAMLSTFKPASYQWAKDNMEVDGESDYTISATIYDPPDDETETETPDYRDIAEENGFRVLPVSRGYETGFAWGTMDSEKPGGSMLSTESEAWEACCDENELISEDEPSWSDVNNAWCIVEV